MFSVEIHHVVKTNLVYKMNSGIYRSVCKSVPRWTKAFSDRLTVTQHITKSLYFGFVGFTVLSACTGIKTSTQFFFIARRSASPKWFLLHNINILLKPLFDTQGGVCLQSALQ